jgi:hypothetical protein
MRWIYIVFAVIGVGYMAKLFFAKEFAKVAYMVPGLNFGLTWGMIVVALFAGLGVAKLKYGK